jgi:hypothetical protein
MTAKMHAGTSIRFDYDGALRAARELWQLADAMDHFESDRTSATADALVSFEGQHANELRGRSENRHTSSTNVARGLRNDALDCAASWKRAMDQENRVRYAQHIDHLKSERNFVTKVADHFTGFDWPEQPSVVALPQPPLFMARDELVRYPD